MKNLSPEILLSKAIAITAKGFDGILDKGGQPYILHPLWVMNQLEDIWDKILAVLHDSVEDGIITFQQLRDEGFPEDIVQDLILLSHIDKSIPYQTYIKGISNSKRATRIKKKDLEHNSNITRLRGLTKKDHERMEQYHIAYTYLSSIK